MEKMFKFNGRVVCDDFRNAHIETVVTENESADLIVRRSVKINFWNEAPLRIYNSLYGCIVGSDIDKNDESILMEFLRLVFNRDSVDFDECVALDTDTPDEFDDT